MGWREALFSLNARSIGKTTHAPGTAGAFIRYIARDEAQPVIIVQHMPEDAREARTWMDRAERAMRKNARVMDKLRIALPRDLSETERARLVRDYMAELTGGRIPWYAAIHQTGKDAHNPHVHIGLVDRDIDTGKRVLRLSDNARDREKAGLPGPKAIEWVRERWEVIGNQALERAGSDARLDRRTLKAQGIDRAPTIHEGPGARKINDHVRRPRSRKRINGCGRMIDYPSIDHGRTRREFNAQIIDLNLAKAANSKHPPTVVWAQFEKDEAAKDAALEKRLRAEARTRTAERRGAGKPYDERIKKLSSERKLKLQTAAWNVRERFEGPRIALRDRHRRERQALKNQQSRLHARIFAALDFTGITRRRREAARRMLARQHIGERAEFSARYNDAKKQAERYVRMRFNAEIKAQRTKRKRHTDLLKEKHAQAENFADRERQQREIEREHMRQITQRKIDAWQKEQKEQEKKGGDKGRTGIASDFAKAILKAARQEAERPKGKGLDRGDDFGL
jgi:hypothetical protein